MCGRFNVTSDPLTILLMELIGLPHPGPDNYNAAPTETIVVLRCDDGADPELVPMRWWLTPFWTRTPSTKYSMFNAKAETAHKSPAFREPFKKRHCVVPISGFYEWARADNQKLAYYITAQDQAGLLLAGIWDSWRDPSAATSIESFAILTTDAAEPMRFIHSRAPVLLTQAEAIRWLDATANGTGELLTPRIALPLVALPVSSHVNNARHKDARCAQPIGEPVVISGRGA